MQQELERSVLISKGMRQFSLPTFRVQEQADR